MAGGKRRESVDYGKKVGYFEARPLIINPTKDELSELLKFDMEKDPEYLKEDQDGNKKVVMNIWVEDVKTKQKFNLKIAITNKEREDKAGIKTQYVNRKGWTTWAKTEAELPDWFTEKGNGKWKVAKVGEEAFSLFMAAWLHDIDFKGDSDASIFVDITKLFRGNFKEMNDLIKDFKANTFVALATINSREGDDGEVKEYQSMYNKAFLPGNMFKNLKIGGGSDYVKKQIAKFKEEITQEEHGCQDFYVMGELQEYNPQQNVAAGNETRVSEGGDDDDDLDNENGVDDETLDSNLSQAAEEEELDTKW